MKFMLPVSAALLTVLSAHAMADQRSNTIAGAIIGSAAGAAIGHHVSGRDGAIIGGAIGAATGVAITNPSGNRGRDRSYDDRARDEYIYDRNDDYDRVNVVYDEPPVVREHVVVYRPAPVVVYRPVHYVVPYGYYGYGYPDWHYYKHHGHHGHWEHDDDDDD